MTADEASQGTMECVLPEGGRVLVDVPDGVARDPEVEADLVQVMLDAGGSDAEVCEAIAHYADATGLSAQCFLGRQAVTVAIFEPKHRRAPAGHPGDETVACEGVLAAGQDLRVGDERRRSGHDRARVEPDR